MVLSMTGYNGTHFIPELFAIPYSVGYGIVLALGGFSLLSHGNKFR